MKSIKNYQINAYVLLVLFATIYLLNSCCDHTYRIKIIEKQIDSIKLYKSVFVITDHERKYKTELYRKITNKDSIYSIIESIENSCDYNVRLFHRGMPDVYYTIEISDTTTMRIHCDNDSDTDLLFYGDGNYYLPKDIKALFR